jgi:hypothetical protein
MANKFKENYEKGSRGENFLSRLFPKKGYSFVAGNHDGKMVNTELIEEIFKCVYISPDDDTYTSDSHGPQVLLNDVIYTLPDMLFRKRDLEGFLWIESKLNNNENYQSVDIPCDRFHEYWMFRAATHTDVWICIILKNKNKCKVYLGEIDKIYDVVLFNSEHVIKAENQCWGKECYRVNTIWDCFYFVYEGEYD